MPLGRKGASWFPDPQPDEDTWGWRCSSVLFPLSQPLLEHLLYTGLSACWVGAAVVGEGTHMEDRTFWPRTRAMADIQEDGKPGSGAGAS